MIKGFFLPNNSNVPIFSLIVASERFIVFPYFVLDTGFTGDLKVDPKTAEELGLIPIGVEDVTIANGQTVQSKVAFAYASMEGARNPISVIIPI